MWLTHSPLQPSWPHHLLKSPLLRNATALGIKCPAHVLWWPYSNHSRWPNVPGCPECGVEPDCAQIFKVFPGFIDMKSEKTKYMIAMGMNVTQAAANGSSSWSLYRAKFSKNLSSRGTKISTDSIVCIIFPIIICKFICQTWTAT